MKLNIRQSDCQFFINEEQRKVVCVINNTQNLFLEFLRENSAILHLCAYYNQKNLYMPPRFVGVATCSKEDEWNEAVGKKLAFNRAKYNLNRSFFKRANSFVNNVDDALNELITAFNKYGECISKNQEAQCTWLSEKIGSKIELSKK